MDRDMEITLRSLRNRHFNSIFAENCEDANGKILDLIPQDAVVGIGDSTTIRQLGVKEELRKKGRRLLDAYDNKNPAKSAEERARLVKESTFCDVFLTGTNVITRDGKLVNVDGLGNRVAGMIWGHPTTVLVVGKNKIVKDLDEAFHRIRHIIAPSHVKLRSDLGWTMKGRRRTTPCAITGKCIDCMAEDRACNVFTIIEHKPYRTSINVVIINEDLGLCWDEKWPQERIDSIRKHYLDYVHVSKSL